MVIALQLVGEPRSAIAKCNDDCLLLITSLVAVGRYHKETPIPPSYLLYPQLIQVDPKGVYRQPVSPDLQCMHAFKPTHRLESCMRYSSSDVLAQKCDATRGNSENIMLAPAIPPPRPRSPKKRQTYICSHHWLPSFPSEMKTCLMRTARDMGACVIVWGGTAPQLGSTATASHIAKAERS